MIENLALREEARQSLGDRFDLRDFHDVVFGSGVLPLPILRQQVHGYIGRVK